MLNICIPPRPFLDLKREETRHWWGNENHHNPHFCGLYNDGLHLYVWPEHITPASFLHGSILRRFPFLREFGIKTRDIRFIHKGHQFGVLGGSAIVWAYQGENPERARCSALFEIPPLNILFVLTSPCGLIVKLQPAALSPNLLGL
jgi:hypothetical protein